MFIKLPTINHNVLQSMYYLVLFRVIAKFMEPNLAVPTCLKVAIYTVACFIQEALIVETLCLK